MSSTNFVYGTIIASTWLNDVNNGVYNTLPLKANLISPSFTTPVLGVATATSINKVTITQPATGATLTIPDGQTATISGTSSGTNTGDQLLFKTITVSGQSDVVADTTSDTLTLAAGSGIIITTNASTDTVTITGTTPTETARVTNLSADDTLTNASANSQIITPTTSNVSIILPDMTTMTVSKSAFILKNASSIYHLGIRSADNTLVSTLAPNATTILSINSVASANSGYTLSNYETGIFPKVESTFDPAVISAVLPLNILNKLATATVSSVAHSNTLHTIALKGVTANTIYLAAVDTTLATPVGTPQLIATVAGTIGKCYIQSTSATTGILIYTSSSASVLRARAFTIAAGVYTFGTDVSLAAVAVANFNVIQLSGGQIILAYKDTTNTAHKIIAMTVAANTITAGAIVTLTGNDVDANFGPHLYATSSNSWIVFGSISATNNCVQGCSVSTVTITAGAAGNVGTTVDQGPVYATLLTGNTWMTFSRISTGAASGLIINTVVLTGGTLTTTTVGTGYTDSTNALATGTNEILVNTSSASVGICTVKKDGGAGGFVILFASLSVTTTTAGSVYAVALPASATPLFFASAVDLYYLGDDINPTYKSLNKITYNGSTTWDVTQYPGVNTAVINSQFPTSNVTPLFTAGPIMQQLSNGKLLDTRLRKMLTPSRPVFSANNKVFSCVGGSSEYGITGLTTRKVAVLIGECL